MQYTAIHLFRIKERWRGMGSAFHQLCQRCRGLYPHFPWDGCNQNDSNRLEKLQLNAARIVTGLPIFASANSLYTETGWETLAERRKNKKLTLMYKIINNDAPSYLTSLLPHRVNEISNYNLRDNEILKYLFQDYALLKHLSFPQPSNSGMT